MTAQGEPEELVLQVQEPVGGREDGDHYPTPRFATVALLDHLRWAEYPAEVLDPCCGEGAILDVARERLGRRMHGIELDAGRADAARSRGHLVQTGDALALPWPTADLIVTNPPYSHAEAFIRRALEWQRGLPYLTRVCALLRLSWLEPAGTRGELLRSTTPDVWVLPRRPMFDGKGHDSITSAWFCWPGTGRWTVLR